MENETIINDEKKFRKVFAKRLRKLRIDRELTLKEFAAALCQKYDVEITYGSISNYERSFRIPSIYVLTFIADFFNVSNDFLLGVTNIENEAKNDVNIYSDINNMTIKEVNELYLKIKDIGINFNK